jgi:hypothetical protein
VFALGSLTLLLKAVFLFRRSSEGLGLSQPDLTQHTPSAQRKLLPSLPAQAAQVIQDLGTGSLLLWPVLNLGRDIDATWTNPPRFSVFLTGAILFALGWLIRRLTTNTEIHS